ncbi:transcription antitermination factor NusB [Corynebacterium sp. 4HC-13]|uniref:Transcription antitermination protein NusB n=1 Tax=Corynebacterium anserum TaxID=2684406 RepID=A0A7G7YNI5_9CORY|nr:transcription antitermination factor NusB [Corynebacterium anserum]MBC2681626.1 transcription antitermination factor NusB [Corynebacterium anserum]QNH96055.1 transcription antitermination factor NusB [Corynebacterium anserum]
MTEKETKFKRHGSRYKARRRAVDILFEAEFRDIDPVDIVEERQELSRDPDTQVKPVPKYTERIIPGVAEHLDAIDDAIAVHLSSEWRLERLPAVDRAVLRVAAWELLYNDDVPNRVAIVEGVELASEYSHDKAPGYVNVVLDGIGRDADIRLADAISARREAEESSDPADAELDSMLDGVLAGTSTDEVSDADDNSTVIDSSAAGGADIPTPEISEGQDCET